MTDQICEIGHSRNLWITHDYRDEADRKYYGSLDGPFDWTGLIAVLCE